MRTRVVPADAGPRRRLRALPLALTAGLIACSSVPHVRTQTSVGGALTPQANQLILVLLDNSHPAVQPEPGSTPHGYDGTGPYGVGDRARAAAAALSRSYHLAPVREWPIVPLQLDCLVYALPPHADRTALLRQLSQDRRVRLAEPMQQFATMARAGGSPYNDPYYPLQWGLSAMQVAAAQRRSGGQGVDVAVIDTGADVQHPDLSGRIAAAVNFVDHDESAFRRDRHGTLVAGLIAADANNGVGIVGISPRARLLIFKACEPLSPGALAAQCNSFTLALALSAAIERRVPIVNLSLSGPADPLLAQLLRRGEQQGMLFVGAVPPDGQLSGFPLGTAGVVAAQESERPLRVPRVLPAPGSDVLSLTPAGHYDFASGSSLAAAQVSGALALLHAAAPEAGQARLLGALQRSLRRSVSHGEVIDLCTAVAALRPHEGCVPYNR